MRKYSDSLKVQQPTADMIPANHLVLHVHISDHSYTIWMINIVSLLPVQTPLELNALPTITS